MFLWSNARVRRLRRALPWALAAGVLAIVFRSLGEGLVQASRDLYAHDFPDTYYLVQRWRQLEVPLWLPNARLGQPFLALLYTQALYPPRIVLGLLFGQVLGTNVLHAFHSTWAFAGLFLAARRFGLGRWAAFIAAAPFSLSPFYVEFAQNLSFASTAAWAGWIVLAAEHLRRVPGMRAAAWLALALGAAFHCGSPEMWLWEVMAAALVTGRRLKWFSVAVVLALMIAAVVALPAAELSREYTKPGEVPAGLTEWSLSWAQLVSIGVPDADLPRAGGYWGGADQRFLFSLFIGSLATMLALIGVRERRARPFVVLAVVCLLLALGKHLVISEWLLRVPPFRLFRYPVKYGVGALFALSVLAGFGARRLGALVRRRRSLPVVTGLLGLGVGLFAASRLEGVREGFHDGAPWFLGGAAVLAVCGWATVKNSPGASALRRVEGRLVLPVMAVAMAVELVAVPHETWPRLSAARLSEPSDLARELRRDAHGRLSIRVDMDDSDPQQSGPWDLDGATDTIVLEGRRRLSGLRFVEEGLRASGGYGFRDPWRLSRAFKHGASAFSLAGVSHFVRNTHQSPGFPGPVPRLTAIEDVWTWTWDQARPRSFLVTASRVASDDEAFAALSLPPGEVTREVLIDRGEALAGGRCDSAASTNELAPELIEQHVDACAPGYLVLADAWYPGWKVDVDGAPADAVRAWGFLRAVKVPAGRHVVTWRYRPLSFQLGAVLSGIALGVCLAAVWRRNRLNRAVG